MNGPQVTDLHVRFNVPLPAPALLMHEMPRTESQANLVLETRQRIDAILRGESDRFLVVVGPCSIHDTEAGLEYARKLAALREELGEKLELVMRVYFEKPRTSIGWKGLIMDPDLDGSDNLAKGLRLARRLLGDVLDLGVPTATEFLDPITPQYIADRICWAAIGARTVESQTHRQMASGLSMPVGLKNATNGALQPVINALQAASHPQTFFGISAEGVASLVSTTGNPSAHTVLRGGDNGPNFDAASVTEARERLEAAGMTPAIMIDASHANCDKDYEKMPGVFDSIVDQRVAGEKAIIGAMLESNLVAGNQKIDPDLSKLTHGQSITDPCIDWETTERILRNAAARL
ncbi:MAG: 3-deoxy-7-phosphoheptulonate synthase [Verrucomicrobiae bacterium]|nr:3-deoxy-7-phosphoheptulonate synthase [Verrucomicrobiae bacterium]